MATKLQIKNDKPHGRQRKNAKMTLMTRDFSDFRDFC
jgi:hypothetical protein